MIQPVSNRERSRLSNEMRTPIGSQSAHMRAVNWRVSERANDHWCASGFDCRASWAAARSGADAKCIF